MFDERVNIKGVILNNVSSQNYMRSLKGRQLKYTGIECLGYIPRNEQLATESRHLGLETGFEVRIMHKNRELFGNRTKLLEFGADKRSCTEFESSQNMENYAKIGYLKDKFKGKK